MKYNALAARLRPLRVDVAKGSELLADMVDAVSRGEFPKDSAARNSRSSMDRDAVTSLR